MLALYLVQYDELGIKKEEEGYVWGRGRTFSAGVCLHEFVLGAGFRELGRETSELREDFVDKTDLRGEVVLVYVEG